MLRVTPILVVTGYERQVQVLPAFFFFDIWLPLSTFLNFLLCEMYDIKDIKLFIFQSLFLNMTSTIYFNSHLTRPPITEKSVISGTKPSLLRSQQCTVLESSSQIEFLISFTIFLYSLFVFGSFSLRCCNL